MDFFGELRIWSHLLNKFLMENFIFCAVRQIYQFATALRHRTLNNIFHMLDWWISF